MMGGTLRFTITYPVLIVVQMLIYDSVYKCFYTWNWLLALEDRPRIYLITEKYEIKRMLAKTMSTWFIKGKNVYARRTGQCGDEKSWIVHISLV